MKAPSPDAGSIHCSFFPLTFSFGLLDRLLKCNDHEYATCVNVSRKSWGPSKGRGLNPWMKLGGIFFADTFWKCRPRKRRISVLRRSSEHLSLVVGFDTIVFVRWSSQCEAA